MSARFLATCCLLLGSTPFATASSMTEGRSVVSLRLRTGAVPLSMSEAMKKELAGLMSALEVPLQWENPSSYQAVAGSTIVVDLEGDCGMAFYGTAEPLEEGTRIGSTATADGHVLPFVKVNCSVLASLMGPFMVNQPVALKEFFFGRALGRVLAHEIHHILTQSGDHAGTGVAKAHFSAADLMKNRFEFDDIELTRIHTLQAPQPAPLGSNSADADGLTERVDESVGGK